MLEGPAKPAIAPDGSQGGLGCPEGLEEGLEEPAKPAIAPSGSWDALGRAEGPQGRSRAMASLAEGLEDSIKPGGGEILPVVNLAGKYAGRGGIGAPRDKAGEVRQDVRRSACSST